MKTRTELSTMTLADVQHFATLRQGMNALRNWLKLGGRYGVAVDVAQERIARAVMDGLQDGWYLCGDQGQGFTGEVRAWYLAALSVATKLAPALAA
jgi:hypothetical protein